MREVKCPEKLAGDARRRRRGNEVEKSIQAEDDEDEPK